MKRLLLAHLLLLVTSGVMLLPAGCANARGNRRAGHPMLTRVTELRGAAGKPVTLVGTARAGGPAGAAIELRGGAVELPDYTWPAGFVDNPVMVTGTLIDFRIAPGGTGKGTRVYRLGEIETANRWSR